MSKIHYELIQVYAEDKTIIMHGLDVETKNDTKRITHPNSHNAIGYIHGENTIDFSFTEPKDQPGLEYLYNRWTQEHLKFFMLLFGKNIQTGKYDPIIRLDDCIITSVKNNIKAKEEWKATATGYALSSKRINHQYNQEDLQIPGG
jgi:hypothetical protein